ncbi:MAG: transglutaminase domain-containing protein, partial [Cellulomonadaceae bacterium]|nr:transglutaminase domain-containing protein [Cellulomonadaceae bacterium]
VSMLLATKVSVAPLASGVLLALGLLVWVSWRRGTFAPRRVLSLLLLGAVLTASGATVGPWLADQRPRFVLRDELVPPFDPREQASPLSSFRKFVKDWADTDLVTVRGLPAGASVRLATMDAFDGVVWNVAGAEAAQGSGQFRRVGDTIDTSVRGTEATVQLEVHDLPFVWLPTVGYTEQVTFRGADATDLSAALRYNDATGTAVLVDGVPDGTRWTARVVVPTSPDEAQLEAAAVGRVTLPTAQGVPDAVTQFAAELAGTATSPALIARSLEAGLAEQGYFSHGLTDSGQAKSLSGHGADRLTLLLTEAVMVGDGEQYASAMALMAREMGLPARVVLGFRPTDEQEGDDEITFTGDDIQAWVEISFDGYGWVAFWPTPDETRTPQDQTPQDQSEPEPQVRQPPPPPQDPVTPPDDDTEQPSTEETQDQDRSGDQWLVVARIVGVVGGPILVVLGPPLLVAAAKARRRRRRRSAPDGVSQVVGGWDELLDQATDLRRPAPPAATRREVAVQLAGAFTARRRDDESAPTGRRSAPVGGPVAGLAASADAVVFGAGDPTPAQIDAYWAQVDVAVAAMRAVVPRRTRWLSRWSPASLRGWWRRSPARAGRGTSTPDR